MANAGVTFDARVSCEQGLSTREKVMSRQVGKAMDVIAEYVGLIDNVG